MNYILGISGYYHDSAAALLREGAIVAAAQEERFSRKRHDARFPAAAVRYCLHEAGISLTQVRFIVFYDKPLLKFERLLETYLAYAPRGISSFLAAMPVWLKDKLFLKETLKRELGALAGCKQSALPPLLFTEHHQAHAASAFYPSPFQRAAVLCLDGVGEWATTSTWQGDGAQLTPLWTLNFPHSLGLLYSAFTYYAGFKVNSGEYKLMGLAPYGRPSYRDLILDKLLDLKEDGTFQLDMRYFAYATGLRMTNTRLDALLGGPPRGPEAPLTQRHMDLAASIQAVTEEVVLRLARTLQRETRNEYLCLAGGVALNCVANGRLLREGPFRDLWIQPAAGDAGGALGAALAVWHEYLEQPRQASGSDMMRGGYLGPRYTNLEVQTRLAELGARYQVREDADLMAQVAAFLTQGAVVGWFQGRMEFGPRALGGRSILGDPRNPEMQTVMNLKIKFRESFRPFAPSVLAEAVGTYFNQDRPSPYMLLVADILPQHRLPMAPETAELSGIDALKVLRSTLPAITHVDYSARIQTVHVETNPRYHALLTAFAQQTGCPVLVNTSFNVRGEPMVSTPEEAYRCFMRTGIDYLVVENCLLAKAEQPPQAADTAWMQEFELD